MKDRKRAVALILAALLLISFTLLAGCSSGATTESSADNGTAPQEKKFRNIAEEPLKIAFIPLSTSGVACAIETKAFTDTLGFYKNIKFQVFDPQYDPTKQVTMVQECITQKYDAILIEPMDPETVGRAIYEAEMAGIPVMTLNLQVTQPHTLEIKGSDYMCGQIAAEYLCKALNDQGNVVILDAPAAQMPGVNHSRGFKDYLAEHNKTNIKIIDHQNIENWSQDIANQVMRDLLTKHKDIDAVYGVADDMALGAVQAIQAAGKTGEILVWGSQGYPNALKAVEAGQMYGTSLVDNYTECAMAMGMLLTAIQTGTVGALEGYTQTPAIMVPAFPVTKENAAQAYAESHQMSLN